LYFGDREKNLSDIEQKLTELKGWHLSKMDNTKEAALDDAFQRAKSGQLFTHEVAQVDSQLE
jgi:hypothetical protein